MNAEVSAVLKKLHDEDNRLPSMRTWPCRECREFHVDKGCPDCESCGFFEARIGVDW